MARARDGGPGGPGTPPAIQVAAAVVIRGERVLLALRPEGVHLELHWEFPGGKVEPGESLAACLHRELGEELGTRVEILAPWRTVTHRYPEHLVTIHFFRCRLAGPEPRPIGCRELAWAAAEELPRFRLPPADAEIVAELAGLLAAGGEPPATPS